MQGAGTYHYMLSGEGEEDSGRLTQAEQMIDS